MGQNKLNGNNAQIKRKGRKCIKLKGQIIWRKINQIRAHAVKVKLSGTDQNNC